MIRSRNAWTVQVSCRSTISSSRVLSCSPTRSRSDPMNKLTSLLTTTAAAFGAALGTLPAAERVAAATGTERPLNVLFILSDDLRTDLGSYGHPLAQTPAIDRLGAQGVRFENAYCQYPLCNPSRTSMLIGRYPTTTGLYSNRNWFNGVYPDLVSLPKYFKAHGYQTLRTGKVFHGNIDDFEAWTEGGEPHAYGKQTLTPIGARAVTDTEQQKHTQQIAAGDLTRARSSDRWEAVEGEAVATQGDTRVADRAIEHLRRWKQADAPFFLACGFSKPHSPLVAPKEFFDKYPLESITLPVDFAPRPTVPEGFPNGSIRPNNADLFVRRDATPEEAKAYIRAYLACVSYVDWNVGRVLAELDKLGLRESTIVVFWSDHGYQLGEKGKWSKAGSLWEQGARVPLIIHDPRAKGNGCASTRIVQSVDLYPTLAALAKLPVPDGLDGADLTPLLDDPEAAWDKPAYTVWNERDRGVTGVAVRTEKWRYAEFFGRDPGAFLTDPKNDPHELKNLVGDPRYREVVTELAALVKAHVRDQAEPAP
ncbi:sulfatase [Nibricoccus aquaticus]|nr:sulfatase [Nibricoccus aquaticus]